LEYLWQRIPNADGDVSNLLPCGFPVAAEQCRERSDDAHNGFRARIYDKPHGVEQIVDDVGRLVTKRPANQRHNTVHGAVYDGSDQVERTLYRRFDDIPDPGHDALGLVPRCLPVAAEQCRERTYNAENDVGQAVDDVSDDLECIVDSLGRLIPERPPNECHDAVQSSVDGRADDVESGLDDGLDGFPRRVDDIQDGLPGALPVTTERSGQRRPDAKQDVSGGLKDHHHSIPRLLEQVRRVIAEHGSNDIDDGRHDVVGDVDERIDDAGKQLGQSIPQVGRRLFDALPRALPVTLECQNERIPQAAEYIEHGPEHGLDAVPERFDCSHDGRTALFPHTGQPVDERLDGILPHPGDAVADEEAHVAEHDFNDFAHKLEYRPHL